MKKTYKDIPKELRKHYSKEVRKNLWMAVKAVFIFPRLYKNRVELTNMGNVEDNLHLPDNHDYWYVDNSEHIDNNPENELDFIACWWGDTAYREEVGFDYETASKLSKFIRAFKWMVLRNSVWNHKTKVGLKFKAGFTIENILVNTPEILDPLLWRNKKYHGEQSVILKLNGTEELYFRYSYTVPLHRLNPLRLFGYKYINQMRGVETRYLYKKRKF